MDSGATNLISTSSPLRIVTAAAIARLITLAGPVADRHVGMMTAPLVNAAALTLYVIEYSILLSRGFFRKLPDDDLQPEPQFFICFVVMTNAGYFALMFLKDIPLGDTLGG